MTTADKVIGKRLVGRKVEVEVEVGSGECCCRPARRYLMGMLGAA